MMETEKMKDTTISICDTMRLTIKESRLTYDLHQPQEGFEEISSETHVRFHWELSGLASKLGADIIGTDDCNMKDQELYHVTISAEGIDFGFRGFESREAAIRNALEFAERNVIKVGGYKIKAT